jgi:hypothetical protein
MQTSWQKCATVAHHPSWTSQNYLGPNQVPATTCQRHNLYLKNYLWWWWMGVILVQPSFLELYIYIFVLCFKIDMYKFLTRPQYLPDVIFRATLYKFPTRPQHFPDWPILRATLWPWGLLSPSLTRNLPGERWPAHKADSLVTVCEPTA